MEAIYNKIKYQEVTVWFLRTKTPPIINENTIDIQLIRQVKPKAEEYLKLYSDIGKQWNWTERILMSPQELNKTFNTSNNEIYYAYINTTIVGYCELHIKTDEVEIKYFGLLAEAQGKGYGRAMMEACFAIVQQKNIKSIMLHTCSLDSPNAMRFYQKMGFTVYRETKEKQAIFI